MTSSSSMDQKSSSSMERLPSSSLSYSSSIPTASVNVSSFVPAKLDWLSGIPDTNYETWREQMLCLLKSQGLTDYLTGAISLPLPHDQYNVWERNNALVKGWILGSLSDQIAYSVLQLTYAYHIWEYLERKFGHRQPTRHRDDDPKKPVNETTPLHRAALDGDWETANQIFTNDPKAKTNWIDGNENWKPLHIAVGTGKKAVKFVKNLVEMLLPEELESLRDAGNSTALHIAASVGNKEAAVMLVGKNRDLCYEANNHSHLPIHLAALHVQKDVLDYLISVTTGEDKSKSPYSDVHGQQLLVYLIQAEFFDIALRLANKHPSMLRITSLVDDESPLTLLTIKKNVLNTRSCFGFWEHIMFSWIIEPLMTNSISHSTSNRIDNGAIAIDANHRGSSVRWMDFQCMLRKCIEFLAPKINDKLYADQQSYLLLKRMCKEIATQEFSLAAEIFQEAIFTAAELGVREVVEVIIQTFPGAIYSLNKPSGQHIFHKAIENRSVDVFNLIYEMSDHKSFFTSYVEDNYGNNPLHSAGKLAPPHKLSETSGAAIQMQRELQWYREVEKIVHPHSREQKNSAEKTPKMVFSEEHGSLKEAGEKWMKETANSFTFVAALIATVMFTGAITVPGGNESSTGFPMFSKETAFVTFAVADAASVFASATSLLLFVAILTSRYAEEDFLYSLPTKLMFGLGCLFLSIISMMVAFIATLYLVFGRKKHWALFPPLIFACMPIVSFVLFQYPLLRDLYSSTYGRGIFGKKSKHRFY